MKKYSAEKIYTLTSKPIINGVVILNDDNIIIDILDTTEGLRDIIYLDGYICPGFINSHCHIELSYLKNQIEPKQGLIQFIKDVQSLRNKFCHEEILESIAKAENNMIHNGIVAVGDISNSDLSFEQKNKHNLLYYTFIEVFGLNQKSVNIINNAKDLINKLPKKASITPHAPYTVSEDLFKQLNDISDLDTLLSIHNQESKEENKLYEFKTGKFVNLYRDFNISIESFKPYYKTSIQTYLPWLKNGKKLLIHNTFISKEDLDFVKTISNVYFCICPNANIYIENTLPDIYALANSNIPILIGTDSLASNNQLCIFNEIKTILKAFPNIPLEDILTWACKNPANYFGFDHLGTIEIGKSPGLLNINMEKKEVFLITKANF